MALEKGEKREPVGGSRAVSFVYNDHLYTWYNRYYDPSSLKRNYQGYSNAGYSEEQLLPLQRYDFSSAQWSGVLPVSVDIEQEKNPYWVQFQVDRGACCAVLGNCAYTFGGITKYGYAMHELNLDTIVWRRLEPQNGEDGPIHKRDAGMVTCGDEALCVFGGCGRDTGRHQPGATYTIATIHRQCYTNELHLFHVRTGKSALGD